jgi:quercetin dioxygenase-like cupin family protein
MKQFSSADKAYVVGRGYSKRVLIGSEDLGIAGSFIQEVSFKQGDKVPLHHHVHQTEIFYALDEAFFEINGKAVIMQPGDIIVCEPGDIHGNPVVLHDFKILVFKKDFVENDIIWD